MTSKQLSLSWTVRAIFKTLKKFWPVNESVSIKKKENRNAESNLDLDLGPIISLSLSLTITLPHRPPNFRKIQVNKLTKLFYLTHTQ